MRHFSHPHDLKLVQVPRENTESTCSGCELYLFDACYTCQECNYFLHKSCFELPQYTTHKSHPHTLTIVSAPYSSGTCRTCAAPCQNLTYNCAPCQFNVHTSCLRLDHAVGRDEYEQYFLTGFRQMIAEVKPLVEQMVAGESGGGFALPQRQSEWDLQSRRNQMVMDQIKRASDSIDFLGQIGSSSYKVDYRYSHIG